MQILGYVIVKSVMGYEIRWSEYSETFVYRSSTMEGVMSFLRMNGYSQPPYSIPFIIEEY